MHIPPRFVPTIAALHLLTSRDMQENWNQFMSPGQITMKIATVPLTLMIIRESSLMVLSGLAVKRMAPTCIITLTSILPTKTTMRKYLELVAREAGTAKRVGRGVKCKRSPSGLNVRSYMSVVSILVNVARRTTVRSVMLGLNVPHSRPEVGRRADSGMIQSWLRRSLFQLPGSGCLEDHFMSA